MPLTWLGLFQKPLGQASNPGKPIADYVWSIC